MHDVLTINEVAEILRVDPITIRRYIKQGKIPAVTLSRQIVRILRKDIEFLFPEGIL